MQRPLAGCVAIDFVQPAVAPQPAGQIVDRLLVGLRSTRPGVIRRADRIREECFHEAIAIQTR
jgi:hypothetical protein